MYIELFAPAETGGAALYRYRIQVTISGRGSRYIYVDYPASFYVYVDDLIKTAFGLSSLPSGLYTFTPQIRNSQLAAYGPAGSSCSIQYTSPDDFAKRVTNIRFSKSNNKLIVTYREPTDTGNYTFSLNLTVSNNDYGSTYLRRTNINNTKVNPNNVDATFEIDLTATQFANIFVNKTITAYIWSRKAGVPHDVSASKTQIYRVALTQRPQPPNLDSVELDSQNNLIVQFDYPTGAEPITRFRVYTDAPDGDWNFFDITNTYTPNQKNIRVNVGQFQFSEPGTYSVYMYSQNSAGYSRRSSNRLPIVIEAVAPPPPPPQRPNPPTILDVPIYTDAMAIRYRYPSGTQPITNFKFYAGTSRTNLILERTLDVTGRAVPSGGIAQHRPSTTKTFLTPGVTYYFAMKAGNSVGDSDFSNIRSAVYRPPRPSNIPNAPSVRSVSRNANHTAQIVFDYPRTGASITSFKIYEVVSGVAILRRTISASAYRRGQTSISTLVHASRTYSTPGTYTFLMRASNSSGDSSDSNRESFTVRRPVVVTNPMPHFIYSSVEGLNPRGFELTVARTSRAWPSNYVTRSALFHVNYVRNARSSASTLPNFYPIGSVARNSHTGAAFIFEGKVNISQSDTRIMCTMGINELNLFRLSKFFDWDIAINYQVYSSNRQAGSSIFFADSATFDPLVDTAPSQVFKSASFDIDYVYASAPVAAAITNNAFPLGQNYTVDFTPGARTLGWRLGIFDALDRDVTDECLNTRSEKFKYTGFEGLTGPQRLTFERNPSIDILHAANLALGRYKISLTSFNLRGETEGVKVNSKR